MQFQKLWTTWLYISNMGWSILEWVWLLASSTIDRLKKIHDTPEVRTNWHENATWVNFAESPIDPEAWMGDILREIWLVPRVLRVFETWTITSAMVLGSIREHNDARTLGLSDFRTLFVPLSFPDGVAQFWTGVNSSNEHLVQISRWWAVCFNQEYQHHLIFHAKNALWTWVAIFVTRESFEWIMRKSLSFPSSSPTTP